MGKPLTATATRTSTQNINSRYCNHFVTISAFLIWQGCGSSSIGSLSMRVFKTRTPTGREHFKCQDNGVSHIFILIISNGEKILSNINVVEWRQVKRENGSLPVAVRVSKTRVLKLPFKKWHWSGRRLIKGRNENVSSSAEVLHKTSNLAMSHCCFADDGKEMNKNEKHTWKALVLLPTKYSKLWRSRCLCRCLRNDDGYGNDSAKKQ